MKTKAMHFFHSLLFISFLCLFNTTIFAQTGTIEGTIVDKESGKGIPFATITVRTNDVSIGVQTDKNGNCLIKNIPIGNWVLHIKSIGYEEKKIPISVKIDEITVVKNDLQKDLKMFDALHSIGSQMAVCNPHLAPIQPLPNIEVSHAAIDVLKDKMDEKEALEGGKWVKTGKARNAFSANPEDAYTMEWIADSAPASTPSAALPTTVTSSKPKPAPKAKKEFSSLKRPLSYSSTRSISPPPPPPPASAVNEFAISPSVVASSIVEPKSSKKVYKKKSTRSATTAINRLRSLKRKSTKASMLGSTTRELSYMADTDRAPSDDFEPVALFDAETPAQPTVAAGTLTAGEVHDFSKWNLWQDIAADKLKRWQQHWRIKPTERYTLQVTTEDGLPMVDTEVRLRSEDGTAVWTARTDNTGKAELWANVFRKFPKNTPTKTTNITNNTRASDLLRSLKKNKETSKEVATSSSITKAISYLTDEKMAHTDGSKSTTKKTTTIGEKTPSKTTQNTTYTLEAIYDNQTYTVKKVSPFHKGINVVEIPTKCNISNNLDILMVVDATGSMGDEIHYLKAELNDVIERVQSQHTQLNINLGSVFYRDRGEAYVTKKSDFSANIEQTISFIKAQSAAGGGDNPEAVDEALKVAIDDMEWSEQAVARLLFLVLDAPPHHSPQILERLQRLSAKAAQKGIRIVPITGSGIQKSSEYLMRSLALTTNGTYVFLTDDSGVGNPHIKPTTDEYKVEMLNDLMIRLIDQYVQAPDCEDVESFVKNVKKQDGNLDKEIENLLKFYPNPTKGELTIKTKQEIPELFITDLTGKILLRLTDLDRKTKVDLGQFPSGIYLIRYPIGEDKWKSAKVMVVR